MARLKTGEPTSLEARRRPTYRRTKPNIKVQSAERVTLSPKESTKITGFGLNVTYDLLNNREMPGIQAGNRWFIPKNALLIWLDERARAGMETPLNAA